MAAKTNKAREALAEMFVNALSEDKLPWQQPWITELPWYGEHRNAVSDAPYRGFNAVILWATAAERKYGDPRWCTYKQAQEKDWQVRKGEKGVSLEFWSIYDTATKKKISQWEAARIVGEDPNRQEDLRPISSVFTVFNAEQIDGIPELEKPAKVEQGQENELLRDFCDAYLTNEGIPLHTGSAAYYSPASDSITMPPKESFLGELSYYDTLLHEESHSTMSSKRLDREKEADKSYATEELRAEIAGAFLLSAACGVVPQEIQDSNKAYVQSWAKSIADDPNVLAKAIRDAETIADYIAEKGELSRLQEQYRNAEVENIVLNDHECQVVDRFRESLYRCVIAETVTQDGFYYAQVTGPGHEPQVFEYDYRPDREKVISDYVDWTTERAAAYIEAGEPVPQPVLTDEERMYVLMDLKNVDQESIPSIIRAMKANRAALMEIYEETYGSKPSETVKHLVDKLGYEDALVTVAELVNNVPEYDGRVYSSLRDWAAMVKGAADRETLEHYGFYAPSGIHPAHINQLGDAMREFWMRKDLLDISSEEVSAVIKQREELAKGTPLEGLQMYVNAHRAEQKEQDRQIEV